MSLINLLRDPNTFNIGINRGNGISPNRNLAYGGPSKSIRYGDRSGETKAPSYHLVPRVSWDYSDNNANPTYLDGGKKSHFDDPFPDFMFRGSFGTYKDRLRLDIKRITNFLFGGHGRGAQFIIRQGALQLLNPQINEKVYNLGINTLIQVATSGLVRFKRAGLFPEPVGSPDGADLVSELTGNLGASAGGILGDLLQGGGYLTLMGARTRGAQGNRYNLGDPGRKTPPALFSVESLIGVNPLEDKTNLPYNVAVPEHKKDKLTLKEIFNLKPGELASDLKDIDDFVPFRFEILNSNNVLYSKVIAFRAYITNFQDNFTANHNNIKLNGRGETFYTYNSFLRTISLNFKIAALSRDEMKPLYQKLNYLAAQTAPNYSKFGRIRTPYMKLTVGDYFKKLTGILTSVNVSWSSEYPWEIRLDPDELDKNMKVLPQVLDVSINFTPIHDFVPDNEVDTPFIGLNANSSKDANWLPQNIDPSEYQQPSNTPPSEGESTSYVVQPGDTLSGISSKFGISNWQDLADANGITDPTSLQAGATLVIPNTGTSSATDGGSTYSFTSNQGVTARDKQAAIDMMNQGSQPGMNIN